MADAHSMTAPDPRQPLVQTIRVENQQDLWSWLSICPHSQTMVADCKQAQRQLIFALPCNQWSCRHCAIRKTKRLAFKTEKAKPNRLLTLTVDPKLHANPRAAFDETRRKIPDFIKCLRRDYGEVEYLRVTEVTRKGWPHYHFLLRSAFIPHAKARDYWTYFSGATIVDLRQVKDTFRCYNYLVKYLTKMHHIEWTGRHVSYSRGFFLDDDDNPFKPRVLSNHMIYNQHPCTYFMNYPPGTELTRLESRTYSTDTTDTHKGPIDPWSLHQASAFAMAPQLPHEGRRPATRLKTPLG